VKPRTVVRATACVAVAGFAFVWLHSGAPGDATCEQSRFVPSSGFSAWPPGARCSYGEPVRTDVIVNGWYAAVLVVLAFALVWATRIMARRV
jgi:hypothetical protein